jgi:hypothetical protein
MAGASVATGAGVPHAVRSIAARTNMARVCQITFFILLSLRIY